MVIQFLTGHQFLNWSQRDNNEHKIKNDGEDKMKHRIGASDISQADDIMPTRLPPTVRYTKYTLDNHNNN